jgi:hypothetical protein
VLTALQIADTSPTLSRSGSPCRSSLATQLPGMPQITLATEARNQCRKRRRKKKLTCAWVVRAMSSELAPYSSARTPSAIISPAFGPTNASHTHTASQLALVPATPNRETHKYSPIICTPRMRSVSSSTKNLTWPSVSRFVLAREFARNGKRPTLYRTPCSFKSFSVFPTHATSG